MADLLDRVVAAARDAGLSAQGGNATDAVALLGSRDPDLIALWTAVQDATRIWAREKPTASRGTAWDDLRRAAREAARADVPRTDAAASAAAEQFGLKGRAPVRLWLAAHRAEALERRLRELPAKVAEAARELADDVVERAYQRGLEWAEAERERRLAHYQEWLGALAPLDLIDFVVLLKRSPETARRKIGVIQPARDSWLLDEAIRAEHARRGVGVPGSPESRQALLAQDRQGRPAVVLSPEKRAALADAEALRRRINDLRTRVRPGSLGSGLAYGAAGRLNIIADDLPTEAMAYGARTADDLRELVASVAQEVDEIERDYVTPELAPPAKEPAESVLLDAPLLVPGEAWRYEEDADGDTTPWRPVTLGADAVEGAAYLGTTSRSGGRGPRGTFFRFGWPDGRRAAQRAGMSPPSRDYRDRAWRVAQRKEQNMARDPAAPGLALDVQDVRTRQRGAEQPRLAGLDTPADTRAMYEKRVRDMAGKAGRLYGLGAYNDRLQAGGLPRVRTLGEVEREQAALQAAGPPEPMPAPTPEPPPTPKPTRSRKTQAERARKQAERAAKRQAEQAERAAKRQAEAERKPAGRAARRPRADMLAALASLAAEEDAAPFGAVAWTGPGIDDRLRARAVKAGLARLTNENSDKHHGGLYRITPAGRDALAAAGKPAKAPAAVKTATKAAAKRAAWISDLRSRLAELGNAARALGDSALIREIGEVERSIADDAIEADRDVSSRLRVAQEHVRRLADRVAPPDNVRHLPRRIERVAAPDTDAAAEAAAPDRWDLVLLGCGKAKAGAAAELIDLYTGPIYTAHRQLAEHLVGREGIDAILSARYGWASPRMRAEPYDEQLDTAAKRRAWSERILEHLRGWLASRAPGTHKPRILVLAGRDYVDGWAPAARSLGIQVDDPLAGMQAGERRVLAGRLPEVLPPRPGRAAFLAFVARELVDLVHRPHGVRAVGRRLRPLPPPGLFDKPAKKKAAKKKAAKKINPRELARGTLIELAEHPTIDKKQARQLARDHLRENPTAYRGKRAPKPKPPAKPRPAPKSKRPQVKRPRCAGSIGRLVARYEAIVKRRAGALATRQAARREALLARQDARERTLAGLDTGSPKARARAEKRLAAAKKRHKQQRLELDRRDRAELDALKRGAECYVLGQTRVAKRLGCEDLCTLNLAGGIGGDKTMVALPSSRSAPRTLPARYVLVSAASLIASHDPITFDPRPDYPRGVQERRYERDNLEKGKVISIAQNMVPGLIENTNVGAVDGTPVVTPEGIVLSGNGRTMGTQRHYQSGRRVLAEWLERHAAQFGIDPRAVRTIKDPIVVRVIDVPAKDRGRLVRDFNVALTQSMSAEVEAAALARQLPPDVPRLLRDGNADAGLAEYLTTRASLPLVGALERSGYINASNRSRLLCADGLLSDDGRADFERMLVAAVLPVEVIERSPELARALDRSAVSWLAAAGAGPDWDVRADLAAAAEDYLALRSSKACLAQWQEQASLVRPATEGRPMARALLEVLDLAAARPVVFARIAGAFAASSRESDGLFTSVAPLDALKKAAASLGVDTSRATSRRRCRKAA